MVCIAASLYGMTLDINTRWHYFGNGLVFGVGISLILDILLGKIKKQ